MSYFANYCKHTLIFNFDAGTSRGILKEKDSYYLKLCYKDQPQVVGIGEASPLFGLSAEYGFKIEEAVKKACHDINNGMSVHTALIKYEDFPSLVFCLETALNDLENGGKKIIFENDFSLGKSKIAINGLIWMNSKENMLNQIKSKVEEGYRTLKLKIGALNFEEEIEILASIRKEFAQQDLCIRLDANGAFKTSETKEKLIRLSEFKIHSIEQPIASNNWDEMAELCINSPIPIALDEELINIKEKKLLLEYIKPAFIVLKPTLLGGFKSTQNWIRLANELKIGWWITSALESNIGLNAISQFTAQFDVHSFPQGLGTGKLFKNNIYSPLKLEKDLIFYDETETWADLPC